MDNRMLCTDPVSETRIMPKAVKDMIDEDDLVANHRAAKKRRAAKLNRSVAELAKEVLEVQNACNLSGVVLSWGEAIVDLRNQSPGAGTDTINHHPINVMWAAKVNELVGLGFVDCSEAFQVVRVLAAGE